MAGDLTVTTAHLRELSAKQREAAAEIQSATEATRGVDSSVRVSHGVIGASTAAAVEAANRARDTAGHSMEQTSDTLGDNLSTAATRYDTADRRAGGMLGAQMHSR